MTNNIEEPKPSNKKLWLIMAGVSIAIIGCAGTAFGLSSSSSDKTTNESGTSQTEDSAASSAKSPTIETVTTSATAKELTFVIKVTDVDTKKWSLEYEIADQDRVVKGEGKERTAEFKASVKLSSSASYRIKVRAVNDDGKTTDWSENYTVKLSEMAGVKTIEPAPAYYQTGWATGTDTTVEGAREAIKIAWNTTELDRQGAVDRCLPINSGNMNPTLLLPPLPSVMPKEVTLKYMTNSWDGSAINITYLWCQ